LLNFSERATELALVATVSSICYIKEAGTTGTVALLPMCLLYPRGWGTNVETQWHYYQRHCIEDAGAADTVALLSVCLLYPRGWGTNVKTLWNCCQCVYSIQEAGATYTGTAIIMFTVSNRLGTNVDVY